MRGNLQSASDGSRYQLRQRQIDNFRAAYATDEDFCRLFHSDMNQLYLLAFLLTANHHEAEQCFVRIVNEAAQNRAVFRKSVLSWTKRCLIKTAIRSVFRESRAGKPTHDQWWEEKSEKGVTAAINAITQLPPVDRFLLVMSVLEGYSPKECSLLLDYPPEAVIKARRRVLGELFASGVSKASSYDGAAA